MEIKTIFPLLIQISLYLVIFSIGLNARWQDLASALRSPALLGRAVLAVNIIVPATALSMVMLLPIEPIVKVGIFAMAVSPPAPVVSRKLLSKGAQSSCAVGLYVGLMLAAIIVAPIMTSLVALLIPRAPTISIAAASVMLLPLLLPLWAGIGLATLMPQRAKRLSSAAATLGLGGLALLLTVLMMHAGYEIIGLLGDGTLLAILVTILVGLAAGQWLGGPDPADRSMVAAAAAARHPGFAVLVIRLHYEDVKPVLAVLLFLLVNVVASALWASRMKRAGKGV
jgi:BASS family bile acid:Na+ symporter